MEIAMKPSDIASSLRLLTRIETPAFLWGPPGVGKSQVVAQVAEALGLRLIDIRAVLLDPVDLRGLPTVEQGKAGGGQNQPFLGYTDERKRPARKSRFCFESCPLPEANGLPGSGSLRLKRSQAQQ